MRILLFAGLSLATAILCGCGKPGGAEIQTAVPDPAPSSERAVSPELEKLKGKWMRADGDYTLEIAEVDGAGTMTARYFNPGPIHVSKAVGMQEDSTTKVFVELQDTGYPGCTYSLTYDPVTDQLFGQYFQAAMQQTYDVAFGRLREE